MKHLVPVINPQAIVPDLRRRATLRRNLAHGDGDLTDADYLDAAANEIARLGAPHADHVLDIVTIAAALFGAGHTAGQGVREICAAIRELKEHDIRTVEKCDDCGCELICDALEGEDEYSAPYCPACRCDELSADIRDLKAAAIVVLAPCAEIYPHPDPLYGHTFKWPAEEVEQFILAGGE
jgi:hypothetical protein